MNTFPHLHICEHCASVYQRHALAPGETACCRRCGAVLYRAGRLDLDRWLALTVTAAILFAIADVCPLIRIGTQGLHSEATLWQSAAALAQGPAAPIALPAALAIVVLPAVQIGLLIWLLVHARLGRRAPGFAWAMRALAAIRPWSMVEVGLLGILVAVIKLAGFVEVAPGAGIWAMAALVACLALIVGHDIDRLWELA
jgi:paraquat-inducible protein A